MPREEHQKKVDLPPKGNLNRDPITGEPGSHPIETGLGAAAGGAVTGMAAGAVGGPIGSAVGAVVGAIAGGLAGHAAGEAIDPTIDDTYLRDNFKARPYVTDKDTFETFQPAYRIGGVAESRYGGRKFDDVEPDLSREWAEKHTSSGLSWDRARDAVKDGYERTLQLREERLKIEKTPVSAGQVDIRKEVITETKHVEVPVEREEIVIERRPVSGHAAAGDIKAEEIRIPLTEEKVHVTKEAVVKEEVSVGKRTVHETKQVDETLRKEELKIDEHGSAKVVDKDKRRT